MGTDFQSSFLPKKIRYLFTQSSPQGQKLEKSDRQFNYDLSWEKKFVKKKIGSSDTGGIRGGVPFAHLAL